MQAPKDSGPGHWKRVLRWVETGSTFTDWIIALFTVVLAVTSIYQGYEIWQGSKDTKTLAYAAKKQADKAETISNSLESAVKELEQTIELQRQTAQMDERPYLSVVPTNLGEDDDFFHASAKMFVSGRTPAIRIGLHYVCIPVDEPDDPVHHAKTSAEAAKQLETAGGFYPEASLIAPGEGVTPSLCNVLKREANGFSTMMVGQVKYSDVFTITHHTPFCYVLYYHNWHNSPPGFQQCSFLEGKFD